MYEVLFWSFFGLLDAFFFFFANHERASTLTLAPTLIQAKRKGKAPIRARLRRAFWII